MIGGFDRVLDVEPRKETFDRILLATTEYWKDAHVDVEDFDEILSIEEALRLCDKVPSFFFIHRNRNEAEHYNQEKPMICVYFVNNQITVFYDLAAVNIIETISEFAQVH